MCLYMYMYVLPFPAAPPVGGGRGDDAPTPDPGRAEGGLELLLGRLGVLGGVHDRRHVHRLRGGVLGGAVGGRLPGRRGGERWCQAWACGGQVMRRARRGMYSMCVCTACMYLADGDLSHFVFSFPHPSLLRPSR